MESLLTTLAAGFIISCDSPHRHDTLSSKVVALYGQDLAYIQAAAFGALARGVAPEIGRLLKSAAIPIRSVVDAGCGAGVLVAALVEAGFFRNGHR